MGQNCERVGEFDDIMRQDCWLCKVFLRKIRLGGLGIAFWGLLRYDGGCKRANNFFERA